MDIFYFLFLSVLSAFLLTMFGIAIAKKQLPEAFLAVSTNARSNHKGSPRQFGGLIIFPVFACISFISLWFLNQPLLDYLKLALGLLGLFVVGYLDDRKGLGTSIRLAVQLACACLLLLGTIKHVESSPSGQILIWLPIALLAMTYWTNLVNFMDGLDLLSCSGLGIPLALISYLLLTHNSGPTGIGVLGILGSASLFGFTIHNFPPANVFLGDSGSLFFGGLSAVCIIAIFFTFSPIIAVLPFLYYLADGTLTIVLRIIKGENILKAHSGHAYQLAYRGGMSALKVSMHVLVLNLVLAFLTYLATSALLSNQFLYLSVGLGLTALLIWKFRTMGKSEHS